MPIPESLKSYAAQLGYPTSETMGRIFELLYNSEEKLRIAVALPGTAEEVATKTGLSPDSVQQLIRELHLAGAINERVKQPNSFRLYPGMIELRDATVLNPDVSNEMIRLWDDLVHNELPQLVPFLRKMGVPSLMRVIPIEETVESKSSVLDMDSARKIIGDAEQIVAIPCVCRKTAREVGRGEDCPAPDDLNLCILINAFCNEAIARGIGETLTNEEALNRLEKAEDAGLVHVTRNNVKKDMIMCNCCSCCCTGLYMVNQVGYESFAPSRFKIKLDEEECTGCETCVDRCQFFAIKVDDIAQIDMDKCYGCGVCVTTCPGEALTLEEVRPKEHIRVT